jgi:hypothetical protein
MAKIIFIPDIRLLPRKMMNAESKAKKTGSGGFLSHIQTQIGAFAAAFLGKKLAYFPRAEGNKTIEPQDAINSIIAQLDKLSFRDEEAAKYHLDQVKASYNEVKAATEYQDQKTARLLTILSFLTAATGAVFSKVLDIYPLGFPARLLWHDVVIAVVYILFGIYLFLIVAGALISFYAMQTRFVFKEDSDTASDKLKSLLFFKYIAITKPEAWGAEFLHSPKYLLTLYVKHYVIETYLIATKTSDKVRYIQPAQDILQLAIKVLIVWIIALIIAAGMVPRVRQQNSSSKESVNVTSPKAVSANPAAEPAPQKAEKAPSHDKEPAATMPPTTLAAAPTVPPQTQEGKQSSTDHTKIPRRTNETSNRTNGR